jgi:hypothetical protein
MGNAQESGSGIPNLNDFQTLCRLPPCSIASFSVEEAASPNSALQISWRDEEMDRSQGGQRKSRFPEMVQFRSSISIDRCSDLHARKEVESTSRRRESQILREELMLIHDRMSVVHTAFSQTIGTSSYSRKKGGRNRGNFRKHNKVEAEPNGSDPDPDLISDCSSKTHNILMVILAGDFDPIFASISFWWLWC